MRIVTWNCNRNFARSEKFKLLEDFAADVWVIQECENPAKYTKEYGSLGDNSVWIGDKDNQGLGIFAGPGVSLTKLEWATTSNYYLPVELADGLTLVGVWTHGRYVDGTYVSRDYVSATLDYLDGVGDKLSNAILCGDFNSTPRAAITKNHYKTVARMHELGLSSVYHELNGVEPGYEREGTYFMHRHEGKPYYLDYVFAPPGKIGGFEVGKPEKWLKYSDHVPLVFDVESEESTSPRII